jgi:2'-5' RNA ligase
LAARDEPPADLAELASVYAQAIRKEPFEVVFDMAVSFRRTDGYCLVLGDRRGAAGIYALQRQLVTRFQSVIRAGSLTPHMTLLYTDKFVEKQPIEPIRWMAREFVLIHSYVGLGRHEIAARWPLR